MAYFLIRSRNFQLFFDFLFSTTVVLRFNWNPWKRFKNSCMRKNKWLCSENVCQGQKPNYDICTHYEFGNVCVCTAISFHLKIWGFMHTVHTRNIFFPLKHAKFAYTFSIYQQCMLANRRPIPKKVIKIVIILNKRINHCIYLLTWIDRSKIEQRNVNVLKRKKVQMLLHNGSTQKQQQKYWAK